MDNVKFRVISDGSCDLPLSLLEERKIKIVPYYVSFDGTNYQREATEISVRDFYQRMVDMPSDKRPMTSMPTVRDFQNAFEPYASKGEPLLCICMTEKFSGSIKSANIAKSLIIEAYPDAEIIVLDSMFTTALEGIFVLEAARMRDDGLTLTQAAEELASYRASGRIFFTIGNMSFLLKGGRAGRLAGKIIDRIDIKPMICMKNGEIYPSGIQYSRSGAEDRVITMAENYIKSLGDDKVNFQVVTGYGFSPEEGEIFRQRTWDRLGIQFGLTDLDNYQIGATIGSHTGPYPLGIGVLRRYKCKNNA